MMMSLASLTADVRFGKASFMAGERLFGELVVQSNIPISIQDIRLTLHGSGMVSFPLAVVPGYPAQQSQAHETYINQVVVLSVNNNVQQYGGIQSYRFQCQLPSSLPCTIEAELGRVAYALIVNISAQGQMPFSTQKPVYIGSHLDLNQQPLARDAQERHGGETIRLKTYGQKKNSVIHVDVSIPRSGYTPGEVIPLHVKCNNTERQIALLEARMTQTIIYKGDKGSTEKVAVVATQPVGEVSPQSFRAFNVSFNVPSLPPSGLIGCNIMDVSYTLNVILVKGTLDLSLLIFIGTVPPRHSAQNYRYTHGFTGQNSNPYVQSTAMSIF